jgi:hypothetical protein
MTNATALLSERCCLLEPADLLSPNSRKVKFSANANLLAEVFAQDGRMIQDINKTITINARKEELESIKRGGFVYELTVPVKDPGAYQFRFAVQDAGSERLGAASNFVEVPNVSEGRLALSDIIVFGKTPTGKDSKQFQSVDSQAATAERKFKRGTELSYALIVYNPTLDPVTHRPRLETQLSLYFAGKPDLRGCAQDSANRIAGKFQAGSGCWNHRPGDRPHTRRLCLENYDYGCIGQREA